MTKVGLATFASSSQAPLQSIIILIAVEIVDLGLLTYVYSYNLAVGN
jgi:hypothetical protein